MQYACNRPEYIMLNAAFYFKTFALFFIPYFQNQHYERLERVRGFRIQQLVNDRAIGTGSYVNVPVFKAIFSTYFSWYELHHAKEIVNQWFYITWKEKSNLFKIAVVVFPGNVCSHFEECLFSSASLQLQSLWNWRCVRSGLACAREGELLKLQFRSKTHIYILNVSFD